MTAQVDDPVDDAVDGEQDEERGRPPSEHLARDDEITRRFRERNRMLRGHFAAQWGEAAAVELIAFLEGALTVWLLDPEQTDLKAMYARYLSSLQNGETGPTPPPRG